MLAIAPVQMYGYDGYGAVALDPSSARTTLLNFKAELDALRGKHPAGGGAVLYVENRFDPEEIEFNPLLHTVLSSQRAGEVEVARDRITRDVADTTGVGEAALAAVDAYPLLDVGFNLQELLGMTTRLLKAHTDAVRAGKFPTTTIILTLLGVSLIGGLTVWGISRASKKKPKRRR